MGGTGWAQASRQHIAVGPTRTVRTLADAARIAEAGDTFDVDAGVYAADVAVWSANGVRVRAVGGRVRLLAQGAAAEGKAIWVVRARDMSVEGLDFEGAAVPGRNGAGIRLESGTLRLRDCSFIHNEMGLMAGNDLSTELAVEDCEFAFNKRPDGHNHQLYVGTIKRLAVTGSYFHHGHIGHLLKSRAAFNHVTCNRLTDEAAGRSSYELEFPDGGIAIVTGNIIQQSALTGNPHMVSFGAESYRWPDNELYLVHNTLIDDREPPGTFLRVRPGAGAVRIVDNLLVGRGAWNVAGAEMNNNLTIERDRLTQGPAGAYHPPPSLVLAPVPAGRAHGIALAPDRQYLHPRRTVALDSEPSLVGAVQPRRASTR